MNRIDATFAKLRKAKKTAFIPFVTAGDPDLATTEKFVLAFEQAGADIMELGVPFSDPMADGPTIQAASQRALKKHINLKKILGAVRNIRRRSQLPVALMTYYNPVFHYGLGRFVKDAKAAGVDGLVVPDLPPEEAGDLLKFSRKAGLSVVFFAAPTTTNQRLRKVVKAATGFVYYVSLTGVTGARKSLPADLIKNVRRVKAATSKPVCVGFGISTPQQVKAVGAVADGVIVASAIIKEIEKNAKRRDLVPLTARYVASLARALQ